MGIVVMVVIVVGIGNNGHSSYGCDSGGHR